LVCHRFDSASLTIRTAAPGEGYVLNTVHNTQGDVLPGNIMALVEALDEYAWY